LDLRLDEERPPVIIEYASIREAAALILVSGDELARHLLLRYPEPTNGRDVAGSCPVDERAEQGAVSIEGAHQRVGEPVLGLDVLVEDVSHERERVSLILA
jgi:hypothetical protein